MLVGCDAGPATSTASTTGPADSEAGTSGADPAADGVIDDSSTGDQELVAAAVADARDLVTAYAALPEQHRELRRVAAPLQAHLLEHLAALGEPAEPSTAPAAPARRQAVRHLVRHLVRAERRARDARADDAVSAGSGDLARVLASIAASHAQHAVVLESWTRR